jgi:hypothetical protein
MFALPTSSNIRHHRISHLDYGRKHREMLEHPGMVERHLNGEISFHVIEYSLERVRATGVPAREEVGVCRIPQAIHEADATDPIDRRVRTAARWSLCALFT